MAAQTDTLLRYRPWRGTLHGPLWAALAMARASLRLMFRRRLYWGLFALSLIVFFFFFYGQYLVVWITTQVATDSVPIAAGVKVPVKEFTKFLDRLALNGTIHTFGNFIWFQGYVAVIVLALAGSVLVGNDFFHGSLPFYLSKPIGRWHYVLGKCLGIGAFVNLMTTVPALLLWIEAGLLFDWKSYYLNNLDLLAGVLGYGLVLTVTLSLLVVATAVWVRRTVPMVMVWMGVFVLLRLLAAFLVDGLRLTERWRLIDLWNNLYLCGLSCLGADHDTVRPTPQPEYWEAWAVIAGVCVACLLYLRRRIQAVEIVS
jgi:ABC-type transport system involved in multi-copper enzyme maturation permease subunit